MQFEDLPNFSNVESEYCNYSLGVGGLSGTTADLLYRPTTTIGPPGLKYSEPESSALDAIRRINKNLEGTKQPSKKEPVKTKVEEKKMPENTLRLVKVFIVDTDEAMPIDKRILYKGEEKVTDSTDQELFYEVDIKPLLEKHNEARIATVDKKATMKLGKEVYLEPIKIRDLSMTIVNVAQF